MYVPIVLPWYLYNSSTTHQRQEHDTIAVTSFSVLTPQEPLPPICQHFIAHTLATVFDGFLPRWAKKHPRRTCRSCNLRRWLSWRLLERISFYFCDCMSCLVGEGTCILAWLECEIILFMTQFWVFYSSPGRPMAVVATCHQTMLSLLNRVCFGGWEQRYVHGSLVWMA